MNDSEKVKCYEALFHAINAYEITCNGEKIREIIGAISNWSYAHRVGNGELSDEEQQARIDNCLHNLMSIIGRR